MVWLEHLVGDVHQPLHATSRFTAALPAGDRGGNSIAICRATAAACSKQSAKALHSFWDDALGTSSRPELAATKARGMVKAPADKAAVDDPAAWLEESLAIAKAAVYAAPVPSDGGPATLSKSYEIQAGSFAEQRAALAGARLARLLNAALGGQ